VKGLPGIAHRLLPTPSWTMFTGTSSSVSLLLFMTSWELTFRKLSKVRGCVDIIVYFHDVGGLFIVLFPLLVFGRLDVIFIS
jgi:hypothetical protein